MKIKKLFYKLKFIIEEIGDKSTNRNDKINSLLSSIEDINTTNQVNPPSIGSIIDINGDDYKVATHKVSFISDDDTICYQTTIFIVNISEKKESDLNDKDLSEEIRRYLNYKSYQDPQLSIRDHYKNSRWSGV